MGLDQMKWQDITPPPPDSVSLNNVEKIPATILNLN
jgi:hypothetical protein